MHQALYRKWRPHIFDDVYGQEHITSVLKYEVGNGKLSHAYLFCGSRGVGKTTCAKILAKAVNCENPQNGEPCGVCDSCRAIEAGSATDVLEMDAASNNGVENIRDIRDEVIFAPSMLKYKVYIVDEVHMLSQSAFNALLKTLEEPPSYVIFILATTEQHKLPATIISRCQRFEFRRISTENLSARIELIAREEGIKLTKDASHLIARLSQGGMRDAISLLELCSGGDKEITEELVNDTVGSTGRERTSCVAEAVARKDYATILDEISELVISSKDIKVFWQDMISFWRDMLVFKTTPTAAKYLDLTDSETERMSDIAAHFTKETLLWHCRMLDDALLKIGRSAATARMTAEMTLIKMCDERLDERNDSLLSRISKLEDSLMSISLGGTLPTVAKAPETVRPKAEPKPEKAVKAENKAEPVKETKLEPKPEINEPEIKEKTEIKAEIKTEIEIKAETKEKIQSAAMPADKPKAIRTLRPLRCWVEVLEEMAVNDFLLWMDVNSTKAFTDENGNAVIVFESDFMLERADKHDNSKRVSELLSKQLGKPTPVSFELIPEEEYKDSVIDDFLDNYEN